MRIEIPSLQRWFQLEQAYWLVSQRKVLSGRFSPP